MKLQFNSGALKSTASLCGNHAGLPRVVEQSSGIDDRANISQRFEFVSLSCVRDGDRGGIQIHGNHIASLQQFGQPVEAFTGIEFSGGDAIAKEDSSETLGEHNLAAG